MGQGCVSLVRHFEALSNSGLKESIMEFATYSIHIYIFTYIHIYIHTYIQTYIHIYIYT